MDIVGIAINDVRYLPYQGKDDSTGYFRSFMNFCIDNCFDRIIMTPELNQWFSLAPNDPIFGASIGYRRITGHNGMYYKTQLGTEQKVGIINQIGELCRIDVFVHLYE